MKEQIIINIHNNFNVLDDYISHSGAERIFLVSGSSIKYLNINNYFNSLKRRKGIEVFRFSGFKPNPDYISVVSGVREFREKCCDTIIAVGGGSAIDVAKCIKLFSNMSDDKNFLDQNIIPNNIPFFAIPTTAGSGSEATRFAVIYYNGEKISVTDKSCIPDAVFFDYTVLERLPEYYKKSAILDALCHSIESIWSVNSTDESRTYSIMAIDIIINNVSEYLSKDSEAAKKIQNAAYLAGKAINITQTTAGHAMCYKLTRLYGIAHGHAAALCVEHLFPHMIKNTDKCIDKRGEGHLCSALDDIAEAMGHGSPEMAALAFSELIRKMDLKTPDFYSSDDIKKLVDSVNQDRLKNHPVYMDRNVIADIYVQILNEKRINNDC